MKKLFNLLLVFTLAISVFAFSDVSAASTIDYQDSIIKVESGTETELGMDSMTSTDGNYYLIEVSGTQYIESWHSDNVIYLHVEWGSTAATLDLDFRDASENLIYKLIDGYDFNDDYYKVTLSDTAFYGIYDSTNTEWFVGYNQNGLDPSISVVRSLTANEVDYNTDGTLLNEYSQSSVVYASVYQTGGLVYFTLGYNSTTSGFAIYDENDHLVYNLGAFSDIRDYYYTFEFEVENTYYLGYWNDSDPYTPETASGFWDESDGTQDGKTELNIILSYSLDHSSKWKIDYDEQVELGEDLEVSVTLTDMGSGIEKFYEAYFVNNGSGQIDIAGGIVPTNGTYAVKGETVTFSINTSGQSVGDYFFLISRLDVEYQGADETLYPSLVIGNLEYTIVSAPDITLVGAANMTVEYDSTFVDPGATATDAEDGDLTSSIAVAGSVNTAVLGNYTLTYSVTDASGNTATVDRIVSVVDSLGPVITLNGGQNIDVFVDSTYTDAGASALDAYDGNVTDDIVATGTVDTSVAGTYFIVYTCVDSNGNAADPVTRQINVVDSAAPTISLLGDAEMTIEVGEAYVDPGATASDDTDGDLTSSIVVTGTVNINHVGIYYIHYNVTDSASNVAIQKTRIVNVVDTTDPVAELVGTDPFYVEVGTDYVEPGISAIDAYDGDISNQVEISGTVNVNVVGTYVLTYVIEDAAGNSVTLTRDVIVRDTTAPTISVSGTSTLNSEAVLLADLLTASASDLYDGILTEDITVTDDEYTGNETRVGTYEVTYSVSDSSGNTATKTITITVVDDLAPELTVSADFIDRATYDGMSQEDLMNYLAGTYIPGNVGDTANILVNDLESPWALVDITALISASDHEDGDLTEDITVLSDGYTGHEAELGEFLITYAVQDAGNQTTQMIITIINQDFLSPVINYSEDALTVPKDGILTLADLQLVITDNIDGDITNQAVIQGWSSVDLETIGSYEVQIDVVDASGNAAQAILTINVVDDVAPVITGPDSFIKHPDFVFNAANLLSYYTAEDNIDGDITANIEMLSSELIGNADDPGIYNVVIRVEDAAGNATLKEITVQVDADLPVYLVVDEAAKIIVDSETVLEAADFVDLLIHIDAIQDKVYIPTIVQDTYTASFETEGTYDYDVTLNSADGTEYSLEIDVVVSDGNVVSIPGVIVVPGDGSGALIFGQPWYYAVPVVILGAAAVIYFIGKKK